MTSPGTARVWLGRDDVADLDLGTADDHAGDEVFDQLALLLPGRPCQGVPHARAERLRALGQARDLRPPVDLGLELPRLAVQGPLPLLQLAPAAPVLLQAEHAVEIGHGQPFERLAQGCRATAQDLTARLHSCGSQWPPCARSSAQRIVPGSVSSRQRSSQTAASSVSASA